MNLKVIYFLFYNKSYIQCIGDGTGTWEYVPGYLCNDEKMIKDTVAAPR